MQSGTRCVWVLAAMLLVSGCATRAATKATAPATRAVTVPGLQAEKPADGVRFVKTESGYMVPYTQVIPGTDVSFEMVPIPGGKFKMGSSESEAGRKADEGPQVEVEVEPMWVGKCEVTWGEYHKYMDAYNLLKETNLPKAPPTPENLADAVSTPTGLYDDTYAYEKGQDARQPAITMSQFAARQYTKWLSKLTGDFYRLPSEAEWEYAARAGSTSGYFFGEDAKALGDYAWYDANSKGEETPVTHPVGLKKPNPWGLYDVCGNAAEWTLDQYEAERYGKIAAGATGLSATRWPTELDLRVLRGGSFRRPPSWCRSAARWQSNTPLWRKRDPQRPRSPWWFAQDDVDEIDKGGQEAGIRVVRVMSISPELRAKCWDADTEATKKELEDKAKDGKAARGLFDPKEPNRPRAIDVSSH